MIRPDLALQKPLEDYVACLEKLNRRALPVLKALCTPDLSFQDPYHHVATFGAAAPGAGKAFCALPAGALQGA